MLVSKRREDWHSYQEQAPQKVTTSVRPRTQVDTALRAKVFAMVMLIAVIAIVVTVQREAMIRSGYDLVQTKNQLAKLEKENELLRLDIAKLKSPQRIQDIAVANLGMVAPQSIYYYEESNIAKPAAQVASNKAATILEVSRVEASTRR